MKQRELEELLWKYNFQDEEFLLYLQENPIREITFSINEEEVRKEVGEFTVLEDSVLEYIEECCSYDSDFLTEEREAKMATEMKKVLYDAFFYFKEGISYLDLVQEGVVGLLKGIDFNSDCLEAWIVREMFMKVQAEIQDLKFGFKNFLKMKREEVEHEKEHHHDHNCTHKHDELENDWEDTIEDGKIDKNKVLEKLLHSDVAIDEMEKIIEDRVCFHAMKYRLYPIEIEVLNYYFGLLVEKRYSIFEIQKKFHLEADYAQNIFENAIYKLSTVKGKMEL